MIGKFFFWLESNSNYRLVFCPYDKQLYCCKKKYQYALKKHKEEINNFKKQIKENVNNV